MLAGRAVLFDANVLIYNFWPSGNPSWAHHYSRAFKNLLSQGNPLLVSFVILSEVINRVLRLEYDNYLKATGQSPQTIRFKDFRNSPDGQQVLTDIYDIVLGDILTRFTMIDQSLSNPDTAALLVPGPLDFNDAYIVKLCRDQNLILLTNDADFGQSGMDLLSSNLKL